MVFVGFVWPVLDALIGLLLMIIENQKAKIAISIQKSNVEVEKCQAELEPPQHAIGFEVSSTEDNEEYYD